MPARRGSRPDGFIERMQGFDWGGHTDRKTLWIDGDTLYFDGKIAAQGGQVGYDVRAFGAVGDGVADDGPAINNALAAACAGGGGVVRIPAGTYKISTQVVIPCSGITLEGDGVGKTVLTTTSAFATGMVYAQGRSSIALRDMTIRPGSTQNAYGFYIDGAATAVQMTDILVENVLVDQTKTDYSGCVITGAAGGMRRVTVRNLVVKSTAAGTGPFGLSLGAGDGGVTSYEVLLLNCVFDGFTDALRQNTNGVWQSAKVLGCVFKNALQHGAYFYHCGKLLVADCEFTGNDVGAFFCDGAANQGTQVVGSHFVNNTTMGARSEDLANSTFTGCDFVGNGYGYWLASGQNSAFAGCAFNANTRDGILVDRGATITSLLNGAVSYVNAVQTHVQNVVLAGCTVSANSRNGITIKGVQRTFKMVGCSISANGQADNPTPTNYAEVTVGADTLGSNSTLVEADGCTFGSLGGSGVWTGYALTGIKTTSGELTYLEVRSCRFEGLTTALNVPTAALLTVKGCTFQTITNAATLPTAYEWRGNTISGGTMTPPTEAKGADTAAANNLVLTPKQTGVPNVFRITGATQINLLSNAGWPSGSIITLVFSSTPTVKYAQTASGANRAFFLSAGADFVATANDTLTLMYDADLAVGWYEIARTVIP